MLQALVRKLGLQITTQELQKALTHKSFYADPDGLEGAAASRYAFLGEYVFRGKVAAYLGEWVSGSGTQLQHCLGQLCAKRHMEFLFDRLKLAPLVRAGVNFDVQAHRHVFTHGLLGLLAQEAAPNDLHFFISEYFIAGREHLLPQQKKQTILWQLRFKCRQVLDLRPRLETSRTDELHTCKVWAGEELLAAHESKSPKYAQKKAVKLALERLLEIERERFPARAALIRQKEEADAQQQNAEKQAQQEAYEAHKAELRKKNEENRKRRRELARLKDLQRRQQKQKVQQAKAKKELKITDTPQSKKEIQQYLNLFGSQLSPQKRRILEDKLK